MNSERSIFGPRQPDEIDGATAPRFQLDREFYERVHAAQSGYKLIAQSTVEPNSGKGFVVREGQTFRVTCVEGPQTADVGVWNLENPRDRLNAVRTSVLEGWFTEPFRRLWSEVPYFRPLATCVEDTVVTSDRDLGWRHHFVSGHCTPEMWEMKTGRAGLDACHLNLLEGAEPYGLSEDDLGDCINVHQKARIDVETGMMYFAPVESKPDDYVEFYAELDLLISVSACPNGDGAMLTQIPEKITLHPLGVEIYETGIKPKAFPQWTDWRPTWSGKWGAA